MKAKRKPSAYNLFVKEHMKAYLAEHPGKTNKDAMKHVCLPTFKFSSLPTNISRSAHFGKMHQKIQSAVRKLRRRHPKPLSGRRELQQRSQRVMRVPRLSLAATTEWLQVSSHVLVFDLLHSLRRFGPFGTLLSISALVLALYSIMFHTLRTVVLSRCKQVL